VQVDVIILRFLGVGGLATALQYLLLIAAVELFGVGTVLASALAYLISSVANYLLNYYFTFSSGAGHRVAIFKFAVVVAFGLGINSGLMFLLTKFSNIHYVIAQMLSTSVVLIFNYLAHKNWTYRYEQQ